MTKSQDTTKHTPGPWSVRKDPRPGTHNFDIIGYFNAKGEGVRLANVTSGPANFTNGYVDEEVPTQGDANARLIAAAPDLLDVLKTTRGNIVSLRDAGLPGP